MNRELLQLINDWTINISLKKKKHREIDFHLLIQEYRASAIFFIRLS